jgi:hypothetical protein
MAIEEEDIENLANSPKQVRTDEGQVLERSVDELIKADQYNKTKTASAVPWGMKIAKAKPQGSA